MVKTVYMTTDGTWFESEEEAERYEMDSLYGDITEEDIVAYTKDGQRLTRAEHFSSVSVFEEITSIHLKTEQGLTFFNTVSDDAGYTSPSEIGLFFFIDDWMTFEELKANVFECYGDLHGIKIEVSVKEDF